MCVFQTSESCKSIVSTSTRQFDCQFEESLMFVTQTVKDEKHTEV